MPLLYVAIFIVLFEKIRCDDYIFGVIGDVNATCNSTPDCNRRFGGSPRVCVGGACICRNDYYESDDGRCVHCSAFLESCEVSKCCSFSLITSCVDNVCKCKFNYDQTDFSSCWRRSQGKHNILSFAKLLLGAILALSLAALFGILRQLCNRPDVIESSSGFQRSFPYESFNSIQRYVMQKLKDRPPRYEDIQKECASGSGSSSSHNVWGNGTRPSARTQGSLPPSYQAFSTPSSSVDMTLPPPPYTSAPYEPDLYIPPESYTRTLESTPLVFQISSQNSLDQGQSNHGYQSTETVGNTIKPQDNSLSSISEASTSSTLPSTSTTFKSNNSAAGTSNLPAYSQMEIVLSPKVMNEHYMSLDSEKRSQSVDESAESGGMEYQIVDDMIIVSRVIDSEKLNVVNGKLTFDSQIQDNVGKGSSETCADKITPVDIQDVIEKDVTLTKIIANTNEIDSSNDSFPKSIFSEKESMHDPSEFFEKVTKEHQNTVFGGSINKIRNSVDFHSGENNVELIKPFVDNFGNETKENKTNLVTKKNSLDEKGNPTVPNISSVDNANMEFCLKSAEINDNENQEAATVHLDSSGVTQIDHLEPEVQAHWSEEDNLYSISKSHSVVKNEEILEDKDIITLVNIEAIITKDTIETDASNSADNCVKFIDLQKNDSNTEVIHLRVTDNDLNREVETEIHNKTDLETIVDLKKVRNENEGSVLDRTSTANNEFDLVDSNIGKNPPIPKKRTKRNRRQNE